MSLVGLDLALVHVMVVPLDGTADLDVATVPVIAVLKMASWLDRPAERERDLDDLAHILDDYLEPDDLRRWDDDLIESGLPHEDQSAFALGQDIARIVLAPHLTVIDSFLAAVSGLSRSRDPGSSLCVPVHGDGWSRVMASLRQVEAGKRGE
jgi:predicted nucleotidyltransferase